MKKSVRSPPFSIKVYPSNLKRFLQTAKQDAEYAEEACSHFGVNKVFFSKLSVSRYFRSRKKSLGFGNLCLGRWSLKHNVQRQTIEGARTRHNGLPRSALPKKRQAGAISTLSAVCRCDVPCGIALYERPRGGTRCPARRFRRCLQ